MLEAAFAKKKLIYWGSNPWRQHENPRLYPCATRAEQLSFISSCLKEEKGVFQANKQMALVGVRL